MNTSDFKMLSKSIIYFDSAATSFKPKCVVDSIVDYYTNYTANAHRGDYDISFEVDTKYENTRDKVKEFINAKKREEIVFTSGTTESLNMIVKGYFYNYLNDNDEVFQDKASNDKAEEDLSPMTNEEYQIILMRTLHIVQINLDFSLQNQDVYMQGLLKLINKNLPLYFNLIIDNYSDIEQEQTEFSEFIKIILEFTENLEDLYYNFYNMLLRWCHYHLKIHYLS